MKNTFEKILNFLKEKDRHISEISSNLNINKDVLIDLLKILISQRKIIVIDDKVSLRSVNNNYSDIREDVLYLLSSGKQSDRYEATEIMVKRFLRENFIYTIRSDEITEMWIYHDGIYIPEGKTYIKEFCRDVLLESYTDRIAKIIIDKIKTDTYINGNDFFKDNNPYEIAVKNGILNVKTKELYPFTPNKILFNKINASYNPNAKINKILKFIKEVVSPDDVKIIQELLGFILVKKYITERLFMFLGDGANGKSTLLNLIENFLGHDNCVGIPLHQLITDPYAISELHNKLVNLSGDISAKTLYDTNLIKYLTGTDTISSNRKYKTRITFKNYSKLINSCNKLPKTKDLTYGFFRRWITINFKYRFIKESEIGFLTEKEKQITKIANPNIINEIINDDELSGMLNWALIGLDRLLKQKDFSYSKTTHENMINWLRSSNSFEAFFMDKLKKNYNSRIKKSDIREEYSKYCSKNNTKIENDKVIRDVMIRHGCWEERDSEPPRLRFWKAVEFK